MATQHGRPMVVDNLGNPVRLTPLVRVSRSNGVGILPAYQEILLQKLVHADPSILPIEDIEPMFAGLRPVCMELCLPRNGAEKFVDNLLINADGRICICECKLWNNRESVREVVAQMLDYAAELAGLSYPDLLDRVRKTLRTSAADPIADAVLDEDADEDQRMDLANSIARSLRLGNFLLLLVSDRIRPEMERIADLLQRNNGLGLSFGLVELAIYGAEKAGPYYVQPRVLLKTEIVTRTVFLPQGEANEPSRELVAPPAPPTSLSEAEFFAKLATRGADLPDRVKTLLKRCEELGCRPQLLKSYLIYVEDNDGRRLNLGSITSNGTVEFWATAARDAQRGKPIGRAYMEALVQMLPGATLKADAPDPAVWNVRYEGKVSIPLRLMLDREGAWLTAIGTLITSLRELEDSQG